MHKITLTAILLIFFSCEKNKDIDYPSCPPFDIVPVCPYNDPICHPELDIIGFNHIPLKSIQYEYGYDCPRQATYNYEYDSVGFWLINSNGTNKRRVLPYMLVSPSWSPDGKWIAFSLDAQIFKMPFNGSDFDTTELVQLTYEGRNFFPSWSPDGQWITYDSNLDSPTGLNFVWKMDKDGNFKKRIAYTPEEGETRNPVWNRDFAILHLRYLHTGEHEIFSMDSMGLNVKQITNNIETKRMPQHSPDGKNVSYMMQQDNSDHLDILLQDLITNDTKSLETEGTINYSWCPNNRIVYVKFKYIRISENEGALWIMDSDGNNKKLLTGNNFSITY